MVIKLMKFHNYNYEFQYLVVSARRLFIVVFIFAQFKRDNRFDKAFE